MLHSMSFLITRRLVVELEHLQDRATFVVLPPPMSSRSPTFGLQSGCHTYRELVLDSKDLPQRDPVWRLAADSDSLDALGIAHPTFTSVNAAAWQ